MMIGGTAGMSEIWSEWMFGQKITTKNHKIYFLITISTLILIVVSLASNARTVILSPKSVHFNFVVATFKTFSYSSKWR